MSVLLIDNYDSFTYNLYQYLGELGAQVDVVRNDAIAVEDIDEMAPEHIIISPGPGNPDDAGISKDLIRRYAGKIPILGVCLGHQCIGAAFGGYIIRAPTIMHGKMSDILHDSRTIFQALKSPFSAMRYHSLVIDPDRLPPELSVSARTSDNVIMGVRHQSRPIEGVQFHPESILTEDGKKLLKNFLDYY